MTRYGLLSTFPPTRCGLATFTEALATALAAGPGDTADVVRVLDAEDAAVSRTPSPFVADHLVSGDRESAAHSAITLNGCDVVIVQHEYGIYGGRDGADVVALLSALNVPAIAVLHTVLAAPTPHQRRILTEVCARATRVVVMTSAARAELTRTYGISAAHIEVIPHGAAASATAVSTPGRRRRILTWGLISPGKGIEWGIEALAQLADIHPPVEYVIAGATHPKVLARFGETYRTGLVDLSVKLGVSSAVHLEGRYLDSHELAALVASADVVLLPYDSREQATSGVLVEALAAGVPVVATGFPHAVELLTGGAGLVVPHEDPPAIAAALRAILTSEDVVRRMREAALRQAAETSWPAVADRYRLLSVALQATAAVA